MVVISKTELDEKEEFYLDEIKNGKVIIYPTDTIYGIGCDATNNEAVKKVRRIKQRQDLPFSVIAPSKEWIKENCEITEEAKKWIKQLPGPYTLIMKLKNKKCIAEETNKGLDTVGIRIPAHWFTQKLQKTNTPIITTSVNKTGEEYMRSMRDLDYNIRTDYIFYDGEKNGRPSKIIDLTGKKIVIKER
jgi:L-threonylcarbamoyladenylate synthase